MRLEQGKGIGTDEHGQHSIKGAMRHAWDWRPAREDWSRKWDSDPMKNNSRSWPNISQRVEKK